MKIAQHLIQSALEDEARKLLNQEVKKALPALQQEAKKIVSSVAFRKRFKELLFQMFEDNAIHDFLTVNDANALNKRISKMILKSFK